MTGNPVKRQAAGTLRDYEGAFPPFFPEDLAVLSFGL